MNTVLKQELRAILVAVILLVVWSVVLANARDQGQWAYQSPDVADYFRGLMQPNYPTASCCGASDAYWADATEEGPNGTIIAIITDTRDDEPLARQHIPIGTKIVVPPEKIRRPASANPTGHTLIFIGAGTTVFCYEPLPLS